MTGYVDNTPGRGHRVLFSVELDSVGDGINALYKNPAAIVAVPVVRDRLEAAAVQLPRDAVSASLVYTLQHERGSKILATFYYSVAV